MRRRRRQRPPSSDDNWTALDPVHPVYNFLIEYYGLTGSKGPRRLARWSPDPKLLLSPPRGDDHIIDDAGGIIDAAMVASNGRGGILLENARVDDLGRTLHMKGSVPIPIANSDELYGILYNPALHYESRSSSSIMADTDDAADDERQKQLLKAIAPFQWYASILRTTLDSDPVLHCHGLHEWAMLYHPDGAPPPPSASYQKSLPLRVSRSVINNAVERRGIQCTHVDALRFFAPAAGPLNKHGAELARTDQLLLEQKGCVHAHMDLLKIVLKLGGFIDSELLVNVLEVALDSRKLDVAASPYDASSYGLVPVPVETSDGRRMYRDEQLRLMKRAEPVRQRLLDAYEVFMTLAFDQSLLGPCTESMDVVVPYIAPERLATATPGGLPWRRNLVADSSKM